MDFRNMHTLDKAAINIFIFWVAVKVTKKLLDIPEKPLIVINFGDKKKEKNDDIVADYDTDTCVNFDKLYSSKENNESC